MTHHEKTPTEPLTAFEEAQEVTLKKERSAGRWVVISRVTIVAVVLAFLLFGAYLAFTNIQLRVELSEASDRLAGEPCPTGYAMISLWGSFSPTASVDDSVFREVKVCVPQ